MPNEQREQRELSGILFKNDRKREGKQDADYQGSCTINGVSYWMSAWLKDGAKGKFMSFSFKPKDGRPVASSAARPAAAPSTPAPAAGSPGDADDSLPF